MRMRSLKITDQIADEQQRSSEQQLQGFLVEPARSHRHHDPRDQRDEQKRSHHMPVDMFAPGDRKVEVLAMATTWQMATAVEKGRAS